MAENKLNAKVGRKYVPASPQITTLQVRMAAQDISHWRGAIDQARSILMPRRRKLYELYDIIALDGHLVSVMNKRKISVTNQKVHFNLKGQNGIIDEKVRDNVLETPWFYKLIGLLCDSKPYGHSLVELVPDKGFVTDVNQIPKANVKPEDGTVMWNVSNETNGFNFRSDPTYSRFMIEMGGPKDYGLLMIAAQYVIYKRGGFGDWAQFAELFGMPFREGQYDQWDEAGRVKLEEALANMGGAAYVVTPKGTELKFHDNNGTGKSEVFKDLIEMCNSEISKIFLGNTMTTDNGSSRSQSEVHKKVEEDINLADIIEMEYLLNWVLSEKLRGIGYPIPDGRFFYPLMQDIPLDKRIEMDIKLSERVSIDPEYWYNTYGIPRPADGKLIINPEPANDPDPEPDPDDPENDPKPEPPVRGKKKAQVTARYHQNCDCTAHPIVTAEGEPITAEEIALLQEIYNGHLGPYDPVTMQANIDKLRSAIFKSLSPGHSYGEPDYVAAIYMEANINRFGFDKSLATIYQLNQALDNDETFAEFKKKANKILSEYNHTHLQTEYDFAVATAQNASAWNRQKAQANLFPFLKYVTAGDDRVRPAHAALDGKIFRTSSRDWQAIYPPNGWKCRCEMVSIEASEAEGEEVIDGPTAKGLLGDEWEKMRKGGFAVNRGELNEVFDLNKSYLRELPAEDKTDAANLSFEDAGLVSWSEMQNLPALPEGAQRLTTEKAKADFAAKAKDYKGSQSIFINDYAGRLIRLSEKDFQAHLKDKYTSIEENRHGIYSLLPQVLAHPSEVWMQEYKGKYQYRFIRFYKDTAIVVDTRIEEDGLAIKTWYKMKGAEAKMRSGFVIKN